MFDIQSELEDMTGGGSDYPSIITPLGFVVTYSIKEQQQLLPYLQKEMLPGFYEEVLHWRSHSASELALLAQTQPLWKQFYSEAE